MKWIHYVLLKRTKINLLGSMYRLLPKFHFFHIVVHCAERSYRRKSGHIIYYIVESQGPLYIK